MKTIFRNDDVNANSNIEDIKKMYATIKEYFPDAEIWSFVNILAKTSEDGSAYPKLKPADIDFPDVDQIFDFAHLPDLENIGSHGLYHLDHRHASPDLQEHSIRSSCALLKTKVFVPPFWRWGNDTREICERHGIKFWVDEDWINIDNENARRDHHFYVFHSWKFTPETFAARFKGLTK